MQCVRARQGWDAIEKEILNGQKLQVSETRLPYHPSLAEHTCQDCSL